MAVEGVEKKQKWNEVVTPNLITSNLERLVLSSTAEKAYNTMASEGIASSKKTLELLLARNGRSTASQNGESAMINNKSYTLDTNGRVCLVKNKDGGTRVEEVRNLQKETRELRELEKNLEFSLELIMQQHRKMMIQHLKERNLAKQLERERERSVVQKCVEDVNSKLTTDFVTVTKILDSTIAKEEERTRKSARLTNMIEIETFLMKCLLNMEDIREASVEYLIEEFRKSYKTPARPSSKSESENIIMATGDN
ncbi:unnamed protein product [Caenorhabditis angaria]|uniref:Uncharacterized protein n=1 Tax=Caenorhabditis angaria TaxID=860376 RepID=A0A9P1MU77_9PELO|nr:unnamed protein product [Caenorhabditis angaria]